MSWRAIEPTPVEGVSQVHLIPYVVLWRSILYLGSLGIHIEQIFHSVEKGHPKGWLSLIICRHILSILLLHEASRRLELILFQRSIYTPR